MNKKLSIEKIVHKGYGLSRNDNKTYFIPFTIDKEEAEIEIIEEKKNYTYGFPLKISNPSEHRIKPLCPYFMICGGCDFQHIDYEYQISIKKNIITEFLETNNILPAESPIFHPSPRDFHYRINTKFHLMNNRIGYLKKRTNEIIFIEDCPLLDGNIMNFARSIQTYPPVDFLKIKTDNNNNISSNINNKRLNYSVEGLNIEYDHRVFFQTNKFLLNKLLETIADFISPFNKSRIIELYCGIGIISFYLASKFSIKKITGIDSDNTAINFARINREKNNFFHLKFISGKVERAIAEFPAANVIIADPPRIGISEEVLKTMVKIKPEAIIYLSCEISTFIRDTKRMLSCGYNLKKMISLDMFPQTSHFETIGLFTL